MTDAVTVAEQIGEGLAAAHRRGIVHRDVKPANVMLTEEGVVKIVDFGLAKAAGVNLTRTGSTLGTVAYMSPEQARGGAIDHRSDLWSLGVVLYEMLTGQRPFRGDYEQAIVYAILNAEPEPVSELRPEVPEDLEHVVHKLLRRDPAERYQLAHELVAALRFLRMRRAVSPVLRHPEMPRLAEDGPHNLPNVATRFFGRERELEQLAEFLTHERLVTIQGPGGCGKSRLAIETARRSLPLYPDGIWFVGLAQLTNPNLVGDSVAEVLEIKPEKDRPIEDTIATRIATRRLLLVVDNCEHLVDECARILDILLTGTEAPRFLTTSRETLQVAGEAVFATPSLPAPHATSSMEAILECDSVLLFRDRVSLNNPAFQLNDRNARAVGAICRRLDGIPLAIEMAASRVKVMAPETILERLSDQLRILSSGVRGAPSRHQTLRATIQWSDDLLTEDERTLFHRLSVFAGNFDLGDAEGVCGFEPLSTAAVLDLQAHLVDKSLVVPVTAGDATCYSLLEIVKQYGREHLAANEELELVERRYCDFFLETARVAYTERLERGARWLSWFTRELYNLQRVLTLVSHDPSRHIELAGLVGEFLLEQSRLGLAREVLGKALSGYPSRDALRARALAPLAFLEYFFLDFETGLAKIEEAVEIIREIDDEQEKLNAYWVYWTAKTIMKEWDEARRVLQEGRRVAEAAGDAGLALRYWWCLNWIPINQMRPELVEHEVGPCLAEAAASEQPMDLTVCLHQYADVPLLKEDYEESERRYIDAARSALQGSNTLQAAIEMQGIAMSLAGNERYEKGLRIFGASMAKFEEVGAQLARLDFWMTCIQRTIGKASEAVGEERAAALDVEGRRMGWEPALDYAFNTDRD